ncbi:lytic transglycosylase domain-containing protein [Microbacterium sp. RD1]|uniref:aggregation-promoting factor C-terminal-like domain-containing protein n=1 Tax=Microbacterium sp. RD1 TaxID=3457313 RepID=UPI003FA5C215
MRSNTSSVSTRRTRREAQRRTRRRPILVVGGLAVAAACTLGMSATAPTPAPVASAAPTATFALASYGVATQIEPSAAPEITEAEDAVAAAGASVQAAVAVTSEIAASGLDVGDPNPTVDIAPLEAAADKLENADVLPAPLVPALTEDVAELVASVDTRVSALRGGLEGAIQKKAEEEAAAEKARQEAEAAAAAAKAAKASSSASSAPLPAVPAGTGDNSPAGAQATARGMLAARGWGDDQFSCLVSLWNKESGWRVNAANPSGAYGIPQALPGSKMASAGADWQTSAATQVSWGLGYISGRYGTPCGAWDHSVNVGWY